MAISYPLTLPTSPGNRSIQWMPRSIVSMTQSIETGQQQVQPRVGQWWEPTIELPPMLDADAGVWCATFLALNGREGTFYLGDSVRKAPRGNISGTVTVGSGAVANTTTLPLSGGSGAFAVGDWLQVGTGSSSRLHRVIKVNSGSVDVFPRLRSAYANGTAITYNNPVGVFRLQEMPGWAYDERKVAQGLTFSALEVLT